MIDVCREHIIKTKQQKIDNILFFLLNNMLLVKCVRIVGGFNVQI